MPATTTSRPKTMMYLPVFASIFAIYKQLPQINWILLDMKIFLLFSLLVTSVVIQAQDSWKVCLNGKTIFSTGTEDAEKNIISIKSSALKKRNSLVVQYKEAQKRPDWERYIAAVIDNGHEASRQKLSTFKLKNETLLSLFKNSKLVKIYTWSLPTDPGLQAAVRVRRIHLCTLRLEN